jgi:hypothetical protein
MGLGSFFHSGFRKGAQKAKWILHWMWDNPQLAANILNGASQTIPGVGTAIGTGISAAGKVVDLGQKITKGTRFQKSADEAKKKLALLNDNNYM